MSCQPLTCSGANQLINSLVETSLFQHEIIEWKAECLALTYEDTNIENPARQGKNTRGTQNQKQGKHR